jgi:hypothetical protein
MMVLALVDGTYICTFIYVIFVNIQVTKQHGPSDFFYPMGIASSYTGNKTDGITSSKLQIFLNKCVF